jgi:predicted transcriptional regulator
MAGEEVTKEDAESILKKEIELLRQELSSVKELISGLSNTIATSKQENPTNDSKDTPRAPLFSTGNEGVPTDQQTDAEATQQTISKAGHDVFSMVENLKSDLKVKFRNLTKQEFKVFSAVYILEEEQGNVDYRNLAKYLNLTESSMRDYIMKLQKKGIPVVKTKVANKKVLLNIRQELRQIAPLDALMKVREPIFK